ncbi:hypothetical protein [Paenibacillus sp. N3.4]|nr:hypothetical protein [Paenibacillus sp. N3.4]
MWFIAAVGSAILFGLTGFFMKGSQMRKGSTPPNTPILCYRYLQCMG